MIRAPKISISLMFCDHIIIFIPKNDFVHLSIVSTLMECHFIFLYIGICLIVKFFCSLFRIWNWETLSIWLFPQTVLPEETFIHNGWNGNLKDGNDIALLRLSAPSKHEPIRLPPSALSVLGRSKLLALGWGRQGTEVTTRDLQQAANIQFIRQDVCKAEGVWGSIMKDSMICAFGFTGEDVCQGAASTLATGFLLLHSRKYQNLFSNTHASKDSPKFLLFWVDMNPKRSISPHWHKGGSNLISIYVVGSLFYQLMTINCKTHLSCLCFC